MTEAKDIFTRLNIFVRFSMPIDQYQLIYKVFDNINLLLSDGYEWETEEYNIITLFCEIGS